MMEKLKALANSIDPNLSVTYDFGLNHADERMPILDLKVWIEEVSKDRFMMLHTHYVKEVASKRVIMESSSHGERMKVNVMINECDRIMRICSPHLGWDQEILPHLSHFVKRLKYCGYSNEFRHNVLSKSMKRYDLRMRNVDDGKSYYVLEKGNNKVDDKHDWYKEGDTYESVLFVQATPDSDYRKKVEAIVKKHDMKIKVVERVGQTVKSMLQRSNPFQGNLCTREDCLICSKELPVNCRERGCVYQFSCLDCVRRNKYRGQTGRSMYERNGEHLKNWDDDLHSCPLKRHADECHGGHRFNFDISILSKCFGKPSRRLITEAVMIEELEDNEVMNSRREWSYTCLNKV